MIGGATGAVPAAPLARDAAAGVVLHVVESWGGGVEAVVRDYVASTDRWEHHLLVWSGNEFQTGAADERTVASVTELPAGHRARVRAIAECVRRLQPDVVHAHSSFAGMYTRIAPGVSRDRIVFTPHGYSFERRDVNAATRRLFQVAERALARRTGFVAATSPRELYLAGALRSSAPAAWVPHVLHTVPVAPRSHAGRPVVVAMGRISPAKQPEVFAASAREARARRVEVTWRWIGGGDADATADLVDAGVEVTGWLDREQAVALLREADVYVHCARWESFPVTLLEAAAAGLPIVAWRIPALEALACSPLVESVPELVDGVTRAITEPASDDFGRFLARICTQENQRSVLDGIYSQVAARDGHARSTAARGTARLAPVGVAGCR